MDKLQYDSFYKFMVSAGVVLVATPLAGLYYLLCNGNQILISQEEYDALSTTSMQFIERRDITILYVLRTLPWLLGILMIIGLSCLIYGGIKWRAMQKEIDTQTKLKTREQEFNFEKLTAAEIAAKVINEVVNETESQAGTTSEVLPERNSFAKAIDIENRCYTFISQRYSRSYNIQQNVKLSNYACDILAVSKIDTIDYLFEVKYWLNSPSSALFYRVIRRVEEMKTSYESQSQRNCKCILMIVTAEDKKEDIKDRFDIYTKRNPVSLDIQVYTEDDLK